MQKNTGENANIWPASCLEHNRRDQKKNWQMQIYNILEDRRTTLKIKIRILDAYVGSMIFLYNSELWTVTQDMEDFGILKQKPTEKFPHKNTRADNA